MARTGSETEQGPGRFLISAAAALALTFGASTVAAAEDASDLPSTWHVHDGEGATLGPPHKGIGFFPTIPASARLITCWRTDRDPSLSR